MEDWVVHVQDSDEMLVINWASDQVSYGETWVDTDNENQLLSAVFVMLHLPWSPLLGCITWILKINWIPAP